MKFILSSIIGCFIVILTSSNVLACEVDTCLFSVDEVQELPRFEKGKIVHFISKNLDDSIVSSLKEAETRVFLTVTVEKNGSLSEAKVLRASEEVTLQIEKIFLDSQYWKPATIEGRPVRCQMTIPLIF